MITLHDAVRTSSEVTMADLDGEAVLLDARGGRYFGLNEVGTRIWMLAQESRRVSDLVATLQNEYEIDPDALQTDILAFLDDMARRRLVHVTQGSDG
jgi:hypothetical protein